MKLFFFQDSLCSSYTTSVQSIGQYSVNSCDLTCDLTSDLPCEPIRDAEVKSLNPSTSSTCSGAEDNSNNEFYYDDEFTVPFDARLGGFDKLAQEYMGSLSDDGNMDEFFLHCLSTSKSDSCLYDVELNTSNSSNDWMCQSQGKEF